MITKQHLKLLKNHPATGLFTAPQGQTFPVWIEWDVFDAGSLSINKYQERVKYLGYLLEHVSEPELRLPSSYRMYEDQDFEMKHNGSTKRLGYVFGPPLPESGLGNCYSYDFNILRYKAVILKSLIRDQRKNAHPFVRRPLSAGLRACLGFRPLPRGRWLHKGLHSDSIVFL